MPLPQNKSLFAFFFFFLFAPLSPILRTSTPYSYCFFGSLGISRLLGPIIVDCAKVSCFVSRDEGGTLYGVVLILHTP